MPSPRSSALAGVQQAAPLLLGLVPFGMIAGVTAVGIGLPLHGAVGMSLIVFAGAAQLATIQLLGEGASSLVIVVTALVINLRFVMYSASLAPHVQRLPTAQRTGMGYLLTDQAFALAVNRYQSGEPVSKPWFYFAAGVSIWIVWQMSTLAGALLGASIPEAWGLTFAVPLTFLALLVPALRTRAHVVAALVGGTVAVVGHGLPYNLGLVLAACTGVAAGMLVAAHTTPRSTSHAG